MKRFNYQSEVVRTDDGIGFGRREVPPSYVVPCREQTIFSAQRRGLIGEDTNDAAVEEMPLFAEQGDDRIHGIRMSLGEGAERVEIDFDLGMFEPFATSVTAELIRAKQLAPQDHVGYRVFARRADSPPRDGRAADRVVRAPLVWSEGWLDDWLAVGQVEGPVSQQDYPLFVLEEALQQAHKLCCRSTNEEGGCWLIGNLFKHSGPKPELFGIVHTAIEAYGTTHDRFGLTLSSETYDRLQKQMELRRTRLGRCGELVCMFSHSHPFLPSELYGHDACTNCKSRQECNLSSAFLSVADAKFHNAIFGSAPYAAQMVLGLSPRGELELGVFCLDGGRFRRRGFYRVVRPPEGELEAFK